MNPAMNAAPLIDLNHSWNTFAANTSGIWTKNMTDSGMICMYMTDIEKNTRVIRNLTLGSSLWMMVSPRVNLRLSSRLIEIPP